MKIRFKMKDIGVIVNPAAGAGKDAILKIAKRAVRIFRNCNIILPELGEGRKATMQVAKELGKRVDVILVIGGDGTMSDVAFSLFKAKARTPILGIGAGSTNAGSLITIKAKELVKLKPQDLSEHEVGGILASLDGEEIGLGFNDIVFSDTVLTTLNGKVVQVSAIEYLEGKKTPVAPLKVGSVDSMVNVKRREGKIIQIHKGGFGQMFAAPLEERYLGKGLAGGTSLAAALGLPAGIAITSEPLINYSIRSQEFLEMEPIITITSSFREGDKVCVRGLKEGTCVNVDGNPLVILGHGDEVNLSYIPSAARVLKRITK